MIRACPLLVLLGYLGISVIVTWPLALHFTGETLGPHYADRMQNMWNLWWTGQALLDRHTNVFHTDLLFYPQGVDLYYHALDLPLALPALLPARLFGLVTGYNSSVLLALLLAAGAGYRLAAYAGARPLGAFVGGIVVGFNPLTQVMIQGQTNIVNLGWCVLCMEAYLRAWDSGSRRAAALAGLCFGLAVLTVGYYEGYLLLFFALHLAGVAWRAHGPGGRAWAGAPLRRAGPLLGWGGGVALLVAGPYALAAWRSLQSGQVVPFTDVDAGQVTVNSADLLSFVLPNRDGWLLGAAAPWWPGVDPRIHDFTFLGPVTLALAALGAWAGRRRPRTWLWVALAALGVVLALGPLLQIDGAQTVGGVPVPLPFTILRLIPPFDLMRVPYRFSTLTWIGLGVLAAGGVGALTARPWARDQRAYVLGSVIVLLLLLEMPLQVHGVAAPVVPASIAAVARDPAPGALLELPITQHGGVDAFRMFYQIAHGRPILGGYLSRTVANPYPGACSPFQAFYRYPDLPAQDIVTPAADLLPGLLAANRVGFLAVYRSRSADPAVPDPLPPAQLADLQALAARLGTPLAADAAATTYRVDPAAPPPPFLQLGAGWYPPERRQEAQFRWMSGATADFCLFSPDASSGALRVQAAAFGAPRRLELWAGARLLLAATVPADGTLHPLTSTTFPWPAGPLPLRIQASGPPQSPADRGAGRDARPLTLGFGPLVLVPAGP